MLWNTDFNELRGNNKKAIISPESSEYESGGQWDVTVGMWKQLCSNNRSKYLVICDLFDIARDGTILVITYRKCST